MKRTDTNKPYTANYPPLHDWLRRHDARCLWQLPLGGTRSEPNTYVEEWSFPPTGRVAVIVVNADRRGWEVFTAAPTSKIADRIADADARLGTAAAGNAPTDVIADDSTGRGP